MERIEGVFPAILTPFNEIFKVKLDENYIKFLDFLLESGVDGIMTTGTTGEFHTMNVEERMELLNFVVGNYKGKTKIIAHVGSTNFRDTVKLMDHAFNLEVNAVSVVAPYYYVMNENNLIDYFIALARNFSNKPIILYNIPSFAGNKITEKVVIEVRKKVDNVVGLKDTDIRPFVVLNLKRILGDDFLIFGGSDGYALAYLMYGADGLISVTANIRPDLMVGLYRSVKNGNVEKSRGFQNEILRVINEITGKTEFAKLMKEYLKNEKDIDLGFSRSIL